MSKQTLSDANHSSTGRKIPRGVLVLILFLALLLIALAGFTVAPESVDIDNFEVPIISGLVGLTIAAVGNIVVGLIQRATSKEAAIALSAPLERLHGAVDKMEHIHLFHERGVKGIFSNRNEAMPHFLGEIEREEGWLGIVGTSLLGAIDPTNRNDEKQKLAELFAKKKSEGVEIDALLMHPAYGEFRERVENRSRSAVARDIQNSLQTLTANPAEPTVEHDQSGPAPGIFGIENVKLYPGVITAFAIFTKRSVLLNTSTLTGPVYENVAIIIEDTDDANSIYKKFRSSHFDEPWKSEKTISLDTELLEQLLSINFADDSCRFSEGNWPSTIVDERVSASTPQNSHTVTLPSGVDAVKSGGELGGDQEPGERCNTPEESGGKAK